LNLNKSVNFMDSLSAVIGNSRFNNAVREKVACAIVDPRALLVGLPSQADHFASSQASRLAS
jgi:hypothetical protein